VAVYLLWDIGGLGCGRVVWFYYGLGSLILGMDMVRGFGPSDASSNLARATKLNIKKLHECISL
jgi:hypothetical protein